MPVEVKDPDDTQQEIIALELTVLCELNDKLTAKIQHELAAESPMSLDKAIVVFYNSYKTIPEEIVAKFPQQTCSDSFNKRIKLLKEMVDYLEKNHISTLGNKFNLEDVFNSLFSEETVSDHFEFCYARISEECLKIMSGSLDVTLQSNLKKRKQVHSTVEKNEYLKINEEDTDEVLYVGATLKTNQNILKKRIIKHRQKQAETLSKELKDHPLQSRLPVVIINEDSLPLVFKIALKLDVNDTLRNTYFNQARSDFNLLRSHILERRTAYLTNRIKHADETDDGDDKAPPTSEVAPTTKRIPSPSPVEPPATPSGQPVVPASDEKNEDNPAHSISDPPTTSTQSNNDLNRSALKVIFGLLLAGAALTICKRLMNRLLIRKDQVRYSSHVIQ